MNVPQKTYALDQMQFAQMFEEAIGVRIKTVHKTT